MISEKDQILAKSERVSESRRSRKESRIPDFIEINMHLEILNFQISNKIGEVLGLDF